MFATSCRKLPRTPSKSRENDAHCENITTSGTLFQIAFDICLLILVTNHHKHHPNLWRMFSSWKYRNLRRFVPNRFRHLLATSCRKLPRTPPKSRENGAHYENITTSGALFQIACDTCLLLLVRNYHGRHPNLWRMALIVEASQPPALCSKSLSTLVCYYLSQITTDTTQI